MRSYCVENFRKQDRDVSLNTTESRLLWNNFLESSRRFPNRVAVEVASHQISYRELAQRAQALAATIQEGAAESAISLTGIFAYRSETAYAGVLGALMAGHRVCAFEPDICDRSNPTDA